MLVCGDIEQRVVTSWKASLNLTVYVKRRIEFLGQLHTIVSLYRKLAGIL